jgi:type VI secretion system secreted protein VgrG
MGWTGKRIRRSSGLRRRPQLEFLDDRCLLSTSTATSLTGHVNTPALSAHRHLKGAHGVTAQGPATASMTAHRPSNARETERPAGSVAAGVPTAYDPVVGTAQTRSTYNVDGTGMTVAVIDTGVDYHNPAFGGGFGPGYKVIAGQDLADGTSDPMATVSQHGTGTAGLIGSTDPNDPGVAPGVKIVALRVTDNSNSGSLTALVNALQWVIDHHQQYNITAVNMSLSDGGNYAQNWFSSDGAQGQQITALIGQLANLNIPVIAAAGNNFNGQQGMGFAAIVSDTISVTATDLSGNLLPNAQRLGTALGGLSATTIAAPGSGLAVPTGDSGTATVQGTSFATALVTGSVILLQDIYESRYGTLPTIAQLKTWLQQGATPIQDPVTGITLGELNVLNSAGLVPTPAPAPARATTNTSATTPVNVSATSTVISTSAVSGASTPVSKTSTTQQSNVAVGGSTSISTSVPTSISTSVPTSTSTSVPTTTATKPAVRTTNTPPPPTTTTTAIATPVSSASSTYVSANGLQGNGNGSVSIDLSKLPGYQTLLLAMNSWGTGGWTEWAPGGIQVQIWDA